MSSLSFPLLGVAALWTAAALPAQHLYTLDVDPALSAGGWSGTTTVGSVANPTPFEFNGQIFVLVANPVPPFTSGEIVSSDIVSDPAVLSGHVPNPIPGLPHLAVLEVRDARIEAQSLAPFTIDTQGNFLAPTQVFFVGGSAKITPLAGPPVTISIVGASDVIDFIGTVRQIGSEVVVDVPIFTSLALSFGPFSGTADIFGDLYATAPIVGGGFVLNVQPLQAGQGSSATASNGAPSEPTWLAYSLHGLGSTPVPQLNLVLDLQAPRLAAGPTLTDAQGVVTWPLTVPPNTTGLGVWFQAFQDGTTSNVPFSVIG